VTMSAREDGSPPPARGARDPRPVAPGRWRITPACAGSTAATTAGRSASTDHPRLRGEHIDPYRRRLRSLGSPPPARGALVWCSRGGARPRITPACAGSTESSHTAACHHPDHPRLRGEHEPMGTQPATAGGSPPPARGARIEGDWPAGRSRITPACAGSTAANRPLPCPTTDHPRLRGEHEHIVETDHPCRGSPPPARGAPGLRNDEMTK